MNETITLADIETHAKAYADRRALLAERLMALDAALNVVKKQHLKEIKRHVALTAECQTALLAAIESGRDLFDKPKTRIFHGIKVGLRKGKGKMEWEDDAVVVSRIKKFFPDHLDHLIITTEKPSADGLAQLDSIDLRKLGVTTEDADDQVVVKAVETDIEQLVKALLKSAVDDEEAA